jgi:hypothetical protein
MATDSISGLQDELTAALAVLDPQIQGVHDLNDIQSITPALDNELTTAEQTMLHRRQLIQTVLDDIAALLRDLGSLEADGYPTPETFPLTGDLKAELDGQVKEVEIGAGVFTAEALATHLEVTFGAAVPKVETP